MITVLKNEVALAEISNLGAELVRFKNNETNTEYIWSGDEKYWTGHSPVLFPIIGALVGGEVEIEGKTYKMGNHGFARKTNFELVESTETTATFSLRYNESTLQMYPYKFELYLTYTLEGSTITITYKVVNVDSKDIYFQLGTHPAFNCPLENSTQFEDYYLEFEKEETIEKLFSNDANLIMAGKNTEIMMSANQLFPLVHEHFYEGALVIKNVQSSYVSLKNKKSPREVVVSFSNFPLMGLWQPKDAPFICIEPWHGITATTDFKGEIKDREKAIQLHQGEEFVATLGMEFK